MPGTGLHFTFHLSRVKEGHMAPRRDRQSHSHTHQVIIKLVIIKATVHKEEAEKKPAAGLTGTTGQAKTTAAPIKFSSAVF